MNRLKNLFNAVIVPIMFTVSFGTVWVADQIFRRVDYAVRRVVVRHRWQRIERQLRH